MRKHRLPAGLLLCLALFAAGCSNNAQSVWTPGGPSALALKDLIIWMIVICGFVWLCVMLVLLRALYAPEDPSARQQERARLAISAALAATVLIVAGLTVASFLTTRAISGSKPDMIVEVRGYQWWWQFIYKTGVEFQTANELHIPVGRRIKLVLEGGDVVHSIWIPSLAGKQDLLPGRRNELFIEAEREGTFRGQCAEFCGLQHSHMAFIVLAETPVAFDAWADRQRQARLAPPDQEAAEGEKIFLAKPCAACHTIRGTAAIGANGPDLTHLGGRLTLAAATLPTTRGSLAAWIADPQTIKPGNNMPAVPLSSTELQAVSRYMEGLK